MTKVKNNGFTLIELIVVISLISIMLFFFIPGFNNAVLPDNKKEAARLIISTVKELRHRSIRTQKLFFLNISLDTNRIWVSNESMDREEFYNAEEKGYQLSDNVEVLDLEYPEKGKISSGVADICFYKNGYSDKVFIHIEDNDNNRISLLIEPFLSKVKLYDEYVGFEDL